MAWSKVKRYLKEHNQTFKLADLEELVPAAFQSVTPEMWKSYCKHVEKRRNFWKKDGMQKTSWRDLSSQMRDDDDDDYKVTEFDSDVPYQDEEEDIGQPSPDEHDQALLNADEALN